MTRSVWFQNAPAPLLDRSDSDEDQRVARDGERCWAVRQYIVHQQELDWAPNWWSTPDAMLRTVAHTLDDVGIAIPDDLRAHAIDGVNGPSGLLAEHFDAGRLSHLTVDGVLLLAYQVEFTGLHVLTTVFDGRWLQVLCPLDASTDMRKWSTPVVTTA